MRPGQLRLEAVEQVEECPRQDDDVVHAAVENYHLAGVAETCQDNEGVVVYMHGGMRTSYPFFFLLLSHSIGPRGELPEPIPADFWCRQVTHWTSRQFISADTERQTTTHSHIHTSGQWSRTN